MSVLYSLKVNRDLLDYKFDGYKLTLDPLAIHRLSLFNAVESPKLPADLFSYQHLKVFGVVNKLFLDPWNEDGLYFVDSASGIHCAHLDPKMNCSLLKERKVVELDKSSERQSRVAMTLSFPDAEHAVVANGLSGLKIYETGVRGEGGGNWKNCYEGEPLGPDCMFLIQHSSITSSITPPSIDVILTLVCKNDSTKPAASLHITKLHWLTFQTDTKGEYELKRERTLETSGGPDYGVVEGGRVFVASEKPVKFVHDSVNAISEIKDEEDEEEKYIQNSEAAEAESIYNWLQKGSEITLYMRLQDHVSKSDITCDISTNHVRLVVKDEVILDGDLCAPVLLDASTWTLSDHCLLEIYLEKVDSGNNWDEVVKGDARGRRVIDEEQIAIINQELRPYDSNDQAVNSNIPFNLQQLEECDQLSSDSAALYCFDGLNHQLLLKVNISNHQWLFSNPAAHTNIPCICLRHDVDGLVFQLSNLRDNVQGDWNNGEDAEDNKEDELPFSWQHTGTLHAFGYLQASKQQKKFTACSPDFTFVAIAENQRHVFIYRQPVAISTSLRNRKTNEMVSRVAKQHLVTLECNHTVEGLIATTNRLYILTTQSLYCVQVVHE